MSDLVYDVFPRVFIIAFCRDMDLFYGSSLVFSSIRTGFPDAEIHVIDNGSLDEAVPKLCALAKRVDATFSQVTPAPHHEWLKRFVETANTPFAVVDPDVVFWKRCDEIHSETISGRLIPAFNDPYTGCYTFPRLHTSFLKFNTPDRLRNKIHTKVEAKFEWDPFRPCMINHEGRWVRYDTLAQLWATMPEECRAFSESENEAYDHLFCGSHVDIVQTHAGRIPLLDSTHQAAKAGNMDALRGIYAAQETLLLSYI